MSDKRAEYVQHLEDNMVPFTDDLASFAHENSEIRKQHSSALGVFHPEVVASNLKSVTLLGRGVLELVKLAPYYKEICESRREHKSSIN